MGDKKTPFYKKHQEHNAKMVSFAGYSMPIQYAGIMDEHRTVRESVGVFDVSHMGEFIVKGADAEQFINKMVTNDITSLKPGKAQYNAMCYPDGGLVDDLIVYKFEDYFMMVVNASNIEKDFKWLEKNMDKGDIGIINKSDTIGLLAVQGPNALATLQKLTEIDLSEIGFYNFVEGKLAGKKMTISRTGYTGEKGFELYHDPEDSDELWDKIFQAGQEYNIKPAGLGARDTLRMEMKYALYGNDIDKNTNPLEAGLGWITKLDKEDFIGKDALTEIKDNGLSRKSIIFVLNERGIPRKGYPIFKNGQEIGEVTSGTMSPILNTGIGIGYVKTEYSKPGTTIEIKIRKKKVPAEIKKPPLVDSSPV
ncbi:MAG: glycine cleavage system aminomethyltransferase GcvT [Candidatus Marinimicrobia bacterium]|nr:glycine cleavage system aminomethyltransferase GcvT [Candidatus Neomarinimicrobiota bacterium]